MWLVIFFLGVALVIVHAVYFSGRVMRAVGAVAPGAKRWLRPARVVYLFISTSVPVLTLGYALYAVIVRPGSIGEPETRLWDYFINYPFWIVTLYSVQCSLLVIPLDLLHLGLRKLGIAAGQTWLRRKHVAVLAIFAVLAVYVPTRIAIDARSFETQTHTYSDPELPAALDGFRIAFVADLQADRHTGASRLAQLVEAVNRAEPDLVLIAGDMITRDPKYIPLAAEYAGRMQAPYGVYSSVGDHDNFAYFDRDRSLREVREVLAAHDVHMLDNEVRTFEIGDASIAVILATANYVSPIEPETTRRLLEEAGRADAQVLVAHQTNPELLSAARAAGVDLFLGGHTHGGQVRFWLPFYDLALVRFETPYVRGAHRLDDMLLVVTSGLGMSVAPFRYRAPAGIDIIDLRAAP